MRSEVSLLSCGNSEDLSGSNFDRWTVLSFAGKRQNGNEYWNCKCSCGTERQVSVSGLKSGRSRSCGCYSAEVAGLHVVRHGCTRNRKKSPEYVTWQSILNRCRNEKNSRYKDYGGRGIIICDRWAESFQIFLDDMGTKPTPNHSIDRVDNNGNYCPENCRWSTKKEQSRNTRSNRILTCNGRSQCIAAWACELGVNHEVIRTRLKLGWSTEDALFTDVAARDTAFSYNGRVQSVTDWANELGISYSTLNSRLKSGWSPKKSVETPVKRNVPKLISFNGKTQTILEWANEVGIAKSCLKFRLKAGWSLEKALAIEQIAASR